ncbi:hypothetical protein FQR65_LT03324 [Abscondita terminalis]|nr:hypothetical protein FQR65_LT03324 [Abscondita terminalis]
MKYSVCASILLICTVDLTLSNTPQLTAKEVPLYIRQSWVKMIDPILALCISESRGNPTNVFKSLMNTEVVNDSGLKCFYKCVALKLNFMEATTGEFQEKEMLRQIEGLTPEMYKKCNNQVKDEVDLCKKSFDMYMCQVHSLLKPKSYTNAIKYTEL